MTIIVIAAAVDSDATRPQVLRRGQLEKPPVIGQRQNRLHGPLAVRPAADDRGPPRVLEAPGDDLRRTGGQAIDEHHHWNTREDAAGARTPRVE